MKTLRLFLLLLLVAPTAQAQLSGGFEVKTGYAGYAMNELGRTVTNYAQMTGYDLLKVTDNYPAYVTFGGAAFMGYGKWEWGIDYTYYTTGARAHYKDYSGEMGFDQVATAHSIGIFGRCELMQRGRFQLKGSLLLSNNFSTVKMNEYMTEGSIQEENKLEVVSYSVAFTPMISPVFKLNKLFYGGPAWAIASIPKEASTKRAIAMQS
jgi:hypothetical protein